MTQLKSLLFHLGALITLLATAVAQATWQGGLAPFDLRYSVIVTGAGLALLAMSWGIIWLIPVALAALTKPFIGRLALWPLGVLGFITLHWAFGLARGFAPLDTLTWLGGVLLYLIPVALALIIGSALGAQVRMGRKTSHRHPQAEPAAQGQRTTP